MSLTTVTVSIVAYEATGGPLPNGRVQIELTAADINGGIILPVPVPPVQLDANGLATVQLWSNSLGSQGTQYRCEFYDADGYMRSAKLATIPPTNCNLHDCFTNAPPLLSDAQAALNGAQAAQAAAQAVLTDPGFVAVKNDLPNIDKVASDLTNVDALAQRTAEIDALDQNLPALLTLEADLGNVNAVANDKANIDITAQYIGAVVNASNNMAAIQAAPGAANAASGSASDASDSAAEAAGSAAAAAYIYPGTYAADPTTRPDASPIQNGDQYFNANSNLTKRYNGAAWVASDINTANLAASGGAGLIGWILNAVGAVFRWVSDKLSDTVSAKDFGAAPSAAAATNDAAFAAAITYCAANNKALYVPGTGYNLSANLNLNGVRVFGEVNGQVSTKATFISSVSAPTYAITLNSGALERICLKLSGTGNGIDAATCVRRFGLNDVYVEAGQPTTPGDTVTPGSIGISYGTDSTPATQAIASTFKKLVVRNFDICYWMRAYANTNLYEDLYALNTTTSAVAGTQSTAGFKVDCHGSTFTNPRAESNFVDGFRLESDSYSNTVTGLWLEGTNTNNLSVDGVSNVVSNPFPGLNIVMLNANSKVVGRTGTALPYEAFTGQGANVIPNATADGGATGWSGTPVAVDSVNTVLGYSSFALTTSGASALQAEITITDPKALTKMAGKAVTVLGVGQKLDPSYFASVRMMVSAGGGAYSQVGTGGEFSSTAPSVSRVTSLLPTNVTGVKLRVFGSGNPANTLVARMALPMLFVGADVNDVRPASASDGANTFYGNQTLSGGGWNTAHMVYGAQHLWVAATGELRTKNGTPASDTDGGVVGMWSPPVTLAANSATPDVSGGNFYVEANSSPTTITNFANPRAGQVLRLLTTTTNTSVANNATIATSTGTTRALTSGQVYEFVYSSTDSKWHEVGPGTVLRGLATYNPPSLATGTETTTTVTVTGAVTGDLVTGVAFGLDTQGIKLNARVSAADTVTVTFRNDTGATIDLASSNLRVKVEKV